MIRIKTMLIVIVFILTGADIAMAVQEASYQVVKQHSQFEIREYTPHIVAETIVEANLEDAGNKAFKVLFAYISGENRAQSKVDMTAPVSQQANGEQIKMTAPVSQQPAEIKEKWVVSFMMPSSFTMETLPQPKNAKVRLRYVPHRRIAAVRYSGFWSEKRYLENKRKLEAWIDETGLTIVGQPIWARYNPPFTPWFLRRNEILIPIAGKGYHESSPKLDQPKDSI